MRQWLWILMIACVPFSSGAQTPQSDAALHGEMLYQTSCIACHDSSIHTRKNRQAKTTDDIQKWVIHWSTQLKLGWSDPDISDVTNFLAARYYKFPCAQCQSDSTTCLSGFPHRLYIVIGLGDGLDDNLTRMFEQTIAFWSGRTNKPWGELCFIDDHHPKYQRLCQLEVRVSVLFH